MSTNVIVNAISTGFLNLFTWVWSLIPLSWINWALNLYTSITQIPSLLGEQASCTASAVLNSFSREWIDFYKVDSTYIPHRHYGARDDMLLYPVSWVYDPKKSTFIDVESSDHTRASGSFDSIGAVYTTEDGCYDLSEWIPTVRVHYHPEKGFAVPYSVVVMGWAYTSKTVLPYPKETDTITFTDMMGEDKRFFVLSGEAATDDEDAVEEAEAKDDTQSQSQREEGEISSSEITPANSPIEMETVD